MRFNYIRVMFLLIMQMSVLQASALMPVDYVDPFIGTSNSGNTYPGAVRPWGMVSVSPQNTDYLSPGYYASSYRWGGDKFYGISHTNISGVGCPEMGSLIVMPFCDSLDLGVLNNGVSYDNQSASAGYYSARIAGKIYAEMTSTTRVGLIRLGYDKSQKHGLILNLGRSLSKKRGAVVRIVDQYTLEGYKVDGGFCNRAPEHRVYFVMKFTRPAITLRLIDRGKIKGVDEHRIMGDDVGVVAEFDSLNQPLLVKTSISYVSVENARMNMLSELDHWDFDSVKTESRAQWNKELSRIHVEGGSQDDKIKFYTGIYHILLHPNIISDANGDYPLMGEQGGIGNNPESPRFSIFSLWDTYRNVHPFLTLVYPDKQTQMLNSAIDMFKENGWLPKWEILSNESFTMVGDPAILMIVDSYVKGLRKFDYRSAFRAMIKHGESSPNIMRPGHDSYMKYGYIAQDDKGEYVWGSVSTSLEYNYADWGIAVMADSLGAKDVANVYYKRAGWYKNLFDKESLFIRPRNANREWFTPFSPTDRSSELGWMPSGGKGYVEGSAWEYSWFVPHDIKNLIELYGGAKAFTSRLVQCFEDNHFVLSNEPDMAYPFLFNYVPSQQWLSQYYVRQCIDKYYNTTPAGIPGNDDAGTLSAWLVFAMMGIYPDCPGSDFYAVSTPVFNHIEIDLDRRYYKGSKIILSSYGDIKNGRFIKSIKINGVNHNEYFLSHSELTKGANVQFELTSKNYK